MDGYKPRSTISNCSSALCWNAEPPPPALSPAASGAAREGLTRARHVDFLERDAENRRLGRLGEEWAVEFEARRLHDRERRPDLARQIEWVSDTRGDGLGYPRRHPSGFCPPLSAISQKAGPRAHSEPLSCITCGCPSPCSCSCSC